MWQLLRQIWVLLKEIVQEWNDDRAGIHAAALAFYTVFSLAPVLVIAIAVAGLALGQSAAQDQVLAQVGSIGGPDARSLVRGLLQQTARSGGGTLVTVLGVATILIGASGAFGQIQQSLNMIWDAPPRQGRGIYYAIRDRALSFAMVLGIGFLLLVSFFASVALSAALHFFASQLPISFIDNGRLIDLGLSFVFATLLFAAIYKVLPDVRIGWRDVWIGAAVTALLFSAGKIAISLYLARSGLASTYGAAGAFVAVLLWIYYSAQIFLFGAEFTQVFARLYGSRRWERTAMTHADDDRHEQRDGEEREEEEVERVGR